ncbi:MAG: PRD domain-containing protein [Treponema sp.]|jgi:beta-glucoside operon transcriptional antiterminator|nr:PRD domain-containing protein [Treponema sp.]
MRNIRKYNNNIVLADDRGQEVIVLGKGIGFQAIPGAEINMALVEKVFIPQDTLHITNYADTLSDLAYEYMLLASRIVDYGKERLRLRLNPSIVVALADHLSVAFLRLDQKIDVQTPLQWEIRHLYSEEYKIGLRALEIIRQERQALFPESEAASIALHFVNAELGSSHMPTTFKIVTIIGDIMRIVEQHFNIALDEESLDFMRFINHVRNLIVEYIAVPVRDKAPKEDDELYDLVVTRHQGVAECCKRICAYLREKHGLCLYKNDVSFLAMHITKIMDGVKTNA